MDGVPGLSFAGIGPGETYVYRFALKESGTYWYHAHSGFQEQTWFSGPIIIEPRSAERQRAHRDYTVLLSDWSDTDPEHLYTTLKRQTDYFNCGADALEWLAGFHVVLVLVVSFVYKSIEVIQMKHVSFAILITALFAMPLAVLAHAQLEQSTPSNGSTVAGAPDRFTLTFSESAHLTALTIQREGDASAQKIEPLPKEASEHFDIPAPRLTAGVYTLKFRNVAADDGHVMSGSIKFTVTSDTKTTVPAGK
jgi:FtsP/CotA-like multicopper oxidase with cupredoxin domain